MILICAFFTQSFQTIYPKNIICGQVGLCPRSPHLAVLHRSEACEEQAKPENDQKTEGFSTSYRDCALISAQSLLN